MAEFIDPDTAGGSFKDPDKKASNAYAPLDITAALGSRLLTGPLFPLSGLAGMAGTVLPGPKEQGANWAKAVQGLQERLSFEPRTGAGETTLEALRYLPAKMGYFAQSRGDNAYDTAIKEGAPAPEATGAAMGALYNAIPAALAGGILGQVRGASAEARGLNAVADETLRQAKDAGYKFPPSATGGGNWFTDLLESIAGKAALKQDATNRNQVTTTRLATQEAGVPAGTALTPDILAQRRATEAAPYREARAIDPAVSQMVDDLQNARVDAQNYREAFVRDRRPETRRLAEQAATRAQAIELQIETAAQNAGLAGLIPRLREARVQIAKIHGVEEGLNRATGAVSAKPFGSAYQDGAPLTGNSEVIGRTQTAYPNFLGESAKNPAPGVNNLRVLAAPVLGMEGAAHAGAAGGFLAGGFPLLGGPMRSLLLSAPMQAAFARPSLYLGSRLPAVSDPMLAAILASGQNQGVLASE